MNCKLFILVLVKARVCRGELLSASNLPGAWFKAKGLGAKRGPIPSFTKWFTPHLPEVYTILSVQRRAHGVVACLYNLYGRLVSKREDTSYHIQATEEYLHILDRYWQVPEQSSVSGFRI